MMGPMQTGLPLVADVYCTRAKGKRIETFEWWRYFDGRHWSKGFWVGAVARQWFKGRTWPLSVTECETKEIMYFKEYKQDAVA